MSVIENEQILAIGRVLNDENRPLKERFRALFTLKNIGGELAIEQIKNGFKDPSALLKHELAYCLGQMQDVRANPVLIQVLKDTKQEPMVRHEAGEALGAIGDASVIPVLEEYSNDPVTEVAETCQLALELLKWLEKSKDSSEQLPENPYASVDPAPPMSVNDVANLKKRLLDEDASLFDRYRAMFTLRNLRTKESVLALAAGLKAGSALFRHEIAFVLGQLQEAVSVPYLRASLEDPEENEMNFMMDLLEMLIQEQPKEMTAECTVVHMRYFSGLLKRIGYLMEIQREKDLYRFEEETSESFCGWITLCDPPSIYGRSLDYWIAKKHYWQVRMAVWSSLDMELSGMSSFLTTKRIDTKRRHSEDIKHGSGGRPSALVAKDRQNPWLKPIRHIRSSANTSSESSYNDARRVVDNSLHNRTIIWYERCKRDKRRQSKNSSAFSSSRWMEPIPEVRSRQIIPTPLKSSMKNTRIFRDVAKTLKNTKVNNETDKISSGPPIKRNTMIDTARERKRHRDRKGRTDAYKKGNAIHPTAVPNDEDDSEHT